MVVVVWGRVLPGVGEERGWLDSSRTLLGCVLNLIALLFSHVGGFVSRSLAALTTMGVGGDDIVNNMILPAVSNRRLSNLPDLPPPSGHPQCLVCRKEYEYGYGDREHQTERQGEVVGIDGRMTTRAIIDSSHVQHDVDTQASYEVERNKSMSTVSLRSPVIAAPAQEHIHHNSVYTPKHHNNDRLRRHRQVHLLPRRLCLPLLLQR